VVTHPIERIGNSVKYAGRKRQIDHEKTIRRENPSDLGHGDREIRQMLEHIVEYDCIERFTRPYYVGEESDTHANPVRFCHCGDNSIRFNPNAFVPASGRRCEEPSVAATDIQNRCRPFESSLSQPVYYRFEIFAPQAMESLLPPVLIDL
jgi:hypothetical protein